ncbi:MAG: methionine ABC transporter permease [Oscillospiraceae bacterium]|nr:methionine ABC transporter permease [Oscillospiraceae bacterium]
MMAEIAAKLDKYFFRLIVPAIGDTLAMLAATMVLATVLGFVISVVLVITRKGGLRPNRWVYGVLNFLVNFIRSFPIMILIVALLPLTRVVMGTTMGVQGAVFPLTVAATPFMARIFENAMVEVDPQLIEAARSFGASNVQIIFFVLLKEAVPSIVSGTTLATVTYLSATTIAGAIGAGGLGSIAMNYGYHRFDDVILYTGVVILCILVQLIQLIGGWIYKRL